MTAGQLYPGKPHRLEGALLDLVCNRIAIRELRLCPVITNKTRKDLFETSMDTLWNLGRTFSQQLTSLDCTVLGALESCRWSTEANDIYRFRTFFGKPNLEVVYAEYDWEDFQKKPRHIRTLATAEELQEAV